MNEKFIKRNNKTTDQSKVFLHIYVNMIIVNDELLSKGKNNFLFIRWNRVRLMLLAS